MSEISDLRDSFDKGLDRIHTRIDQALEESSKHRENFARHEGNKAIHTEAPCAPLTTHVENHKESKASWLAWAVVGIAVLAYVTDVIKDFFNG